MALPPIPIPEPSSAIYFCNRSDIESLWSVADVLASVDDDSSGTISPAEEAMIDDAILRAANQMMARLARRYDVAGLVGNAWCRQTNAAMAAYILATRRGDPAPSQIAELNSAALGDLTALHAGTLQIPGASDSIDSLPSLSNFTPVLGRNPIVLARDTYW